MGKRSEVEGAQFVQYFGPLLDALRNLGGSATPSEAVERIAEDLQISEQTQNELLESGGPRFQNQVAWARFYLVKDGRLDASKRGVWSLTEKGRETHLTYEEAHQIFRKWVKVFAERRETKKARKTDAEVEVPGSAQSIEEHYGDELLDLLKALTPKGFDQDFHFGPGTATVYTRSAPNSTSFHAEPCTSPLLVVARAGSTAHSR